MIRGDILKAARPESLLAGAIRKQGRSLRIKGRLLPLAPGASIYLVAIGKAAAPMAASVHNLLGEQINAGVVTLPRGCVLSLPRSFTAIPCGHPFPDEGSLRTGEAVRSMLKSAGPDDLILVLISGGGSSMLELPLQHITLDDLRVMNDLLLRAGIDIHDINVVRKSISALKGGGLARLASPARCVSLILSDVVGDRLSSIASGPTVLRRPSPEHAKDLLIRRGLWDETPPSIRDALCQPRRLPVRTPWPVNIVVGSNRVVVQAARSACEKLGFQARILTARMQGEARQIGARFGRRLWSLSSSPAFAVPASLIMGGETTVTVVGKGRGGRNQELALAAAVEMAGAQNSALMSFATDGVDGPTDAAGAIITGETSSRWQNLGLDPGAALHENDAYPPLQATGSLIRTGPTGTNLNDVVIGLIYPA